MPNIKSAKKRVNVIKRQAEENIPVRGSMRTAVKKAIKKTDDANLVNVLDKPKTVKIPPKHSNNENELPSIASASSVFPRPLSIENKGAPPIPIKLANAITIVISGKHTPNPVNASVAPSPILPI